MLLITTALLMITKSEYDKLICISNEIFILTDIFFAFNQYICYLYCKFKIIMS